MPYPSLDVIIWDDDKGKRMMASAVSPKGIEFLSSLLGEDDVTVAELECTPGEFIAHITPGVVVRYLKNGNILVLIQPNQGLQ